MGHEKQIADVRLIAVTGISLASGIALIFLAVYGMFNYLAHRPPLVRDANPLAEHTFPPRPRIEEHPAVELHELRLQENQILSTYGWMDRQTGVVRIPIDRAMELQLQRGFPVRKEAVAK